MECIPCPASYYVAIGDSTPRVCPIGSSCPYNFTTLTCPEAPTPCPAGTYSSATGALLCTPCPAGTASAQVGATSPAVCLPCSAGGYYCPAGCSAAPFGIPCGAGNYCPAGSFAPLPCPMFGMVEATKGPANGPAFDVDTAACYNHCFFGGDGETSAC